MGELGKKLGLDELSGGAAGISKALLAEFVGKLNINEILLKYEIMRPIPRLDTLCAPAPPQGHKV